jgi:hypothetical protein
MDKHLLLPIFSIGLAIALNLLGLDLLEGKISLDLLVRAKFDFAIVLVSLTLLAIAALYLLNFGHR